MKIMFLGAAHEVTGSCTLLEVGGNHILVDCGMEQGQDIFENCALPILPGEIDAIVLTHAHIDHSGKIPAMVAGGYRGPVYATEATRHLCDIMLRDSAHIQEFEAEWRNRKAQRSGGPSYVPPYTMKDAIQAVSQFRSVPYEEKREILPGVTVQFRDAGHLLGSASVRLTLTEGDVEKSIVFSGDLGNHDRPLIRDPQPPEPADFVVIESTYGDRSHPARVDYVSELAFVIQQTLDQGGNLVIPAFAVGRTQELLYLIRTIKDRHLVKGHDGFPVYVDSPMAVEATRIYSMGMTEFYDQQTLDLLAQGIDPIRFEDLRLSITSDESKMINFDKTPKVILSASGMCEAGRIRHHLKHNLWRPESTILFVGYQAEGTIGRKLQDGVATVKLFGEEIAVHANIATLQGISGHADRNMMLDWLKGMGSKPQMVFVNHGENEVTDIFADAVTQNLEVPAVAPYSGDVYDLATGECTAKGIVVKATKVSDGRRRSNAIYERLVLSGKRLLAIIQSSKGLSNKTLAKFADQVDALCEKYENK